jgi:hypothetical protein
MAEVTPNARSLPALMCSIAGGVGGEYGLHLSADQVGQRGRQATIRHMDHIDSRHDLEQFGGHVGHGANAGRSEVDLARIGFGIRNKFGDCLGRKRWVHHQNMRATGNTSDRCDIAEKNKIELVVECRIDFVGRAASEERVAIGW